MFKVLLCIAADHNLWLLGLPPVFFGLAPLCASFSHCWVSALPSGCGWGGGGGWGLGSVVVGAVLAAAALVGARPGAGGGRGAAGAALLTVGMVGMHFTGMTAVTIIPDSSAIVPAALLSEGAMVVAA